VLVVFLQDDDGARKVGVLPVDFVSNVHANACPPHIAFVKVEAALLIGSVDGLLDFVPAVEVFFHTRYADGSMQAPRRGVDRTEFQRGNSARPMLARAR